MILRIRIELRSLRSELAEADGRVADAEEDAVGQADEAEDGEEDEEIVGLDQNRNPEFPNSGIVVKSG